MTAVTLPLSQPPTFPTFADFPVSAADGTLAVALDTDILYVYSVSNSAWELIGPGGGGGGGTVTSVALTAPSIFSVSGSPVTTSGTIAITANNESANVVYAGPVSGGAAVPTFRTLVPADIPALSNYLVDEYTLSPTDITNKFVTLSSVPANPTLTVLNIIGGPVQSYSTDFSVSGSTLSWSGLFLDGVLVSGDKLIVQYY